MKKLLTGLLLCIALTLVIIPNKASAAGGHVLSVDATVTEPIAGEMPQLTYPQAGTGYRFTSLRWAVSTAPSVDYKAEFKVDKRYILSLYVEPTVGYQFAPKEVFSASINGHAAKLSNDFDPEVGGWISYVFPATKSRVASGEGWWLDNAGCLHIDGAVSYKGTIPAVTPWVDYKDQITSVVVKPGASINSCMSLFYNHRNLKTVDLRGLDTSGVRSMEKMFRDCVSLTSVNMEGLETENLLSTVEMFSGCTQLNDLNLSAFQVEKIEYFSAMFYNCRELKTLNIGNINKLGLYSAEVVLGLANCSSLEEICISDGVLQNAWEELTAISNVWKNKDTGAYYVGEALKDITGKVTLVIEDDEKIVAGGEGWYLDVAGCLHIDGAIYMANEKGGGTSLAWSKHSREIVKVVAEEGASINSLAYMFYSYQNLTEADLSKLDTTGVKYMSNMFRSCGKLEKVNLHGINTADVVDMNDMFYQCSNLKSVDISGFNTEKVENLSYMFCGCLALTSINMNGFNTAKVSNMESMFNDCNALESLDISGFRADSLQTYRLMFDDCTSLSEIKIHSNMLAKVSNLLLFLAKSWKDEATGTIYKSATDFEKIAGTVTLVRINEIEIMTQPKAVTAVEGTNAKFKIVATGTGLTYKWQYSQNNGSTWINSSAASAVTDTYVLGAKASRNGYLIRCIVKDANGKSVTSNAVKLTVTAAGPVITTQPKAVTAVEGTNATFKVVATGTGLSYQWQYSQDKGTTWKNSSAASSVTDTYVLGAKASRNGYLIRCIIKDANGKSVTSNAVKLTVTAAGPVITTQPKAVTAVEGTNATFKVVATGTGLTYQWQYSQDNGTTWKNSSAASSVTDTYVLGAKASRNGYLIRSIVKDANGKSVTSNAVKLTVTAAGPVITTQPKSVTAEEGTNATFKVVATGTGLTYQWQYSQDKGTTWRNSGAASGVTPNYVLGAKASRNGYLIRCIVKDANGNSVTSSAVKLTVTAAK